MGDYFRRTLGDAAEAMHHAVGLAPVLEQIGKALVSCLRSGGIVYWCGNGGSAGDSQHLAAELVGRFTRDRPPLASVALTTNTSVLTALANDYGYDTIFARQIEALGRPGDVLIGISTSGQSPSVVQALAAARRRGITTVTFTGSAECAAWSNADFVVAAPTTITSHVQEVHIAVGQALCGWVEQEMFG